jgi:FlaA1/EpsC-like NDP-sugar epimerase
VGGVRVYPPDQLAKIVRTRNISQVLLATQEAPRQERLRILALLEDSPVEVRVLPPVEEIASGRVAVSELRRVDAADLLGRPPIPPDPKLMARTIDGRSVMVTGAGGSIGSELVRQILSCKPKRLVLLDASESNLYEIESEVDNILRRRKDPQRSPEIVSTLGSVMQAPAIEKLLGAHEVNTVFHAAAFKHVPILERNSIAGVHNNTIGTEVVAEASANCGVTTFVLISTDKAVRPSSIMGASKRVAEMLVQRAASYQSGTTFSIVRFGNVLDSSGSVVRLFRRQIEAGGPVTVTHPDVQRYFISIPEAAALVIQAGAMAQGGEVFALDMGEPVRIHELARMMIKLSGLQPREPESPNGDVEIVFIGLRPGEKLAEELHLAERTEPTDHPRIMRIREPSISSDKLQILLADLKRAVGHDDLASVQQVLSSLVEDYRPWVRPHH